METPEEVEGEMIETVKAWWQALIQPTITMRLNKEVDARMMVIRKAYGYSSHVQVVATALALLDLIVAQCIEGDGELQVKYPDGKTKTVNLNREEKAE